MGLACIQGDCTQERLVVNKHFCVVKVVAGTGVCSDDQVEQH